MLSNKMIRDLHEIIEGIKALFQFAKERTPTVEDRVAEAIFTSVIGRLYSGNSSIVFDKDVKAFACWCKEIAKTYSNENIDKTDAQF